MKKTRWKRIFWSSTDAAPKITWKYQILALVCIYSFPIGTNWTSASLRPLRNTLRNRVDITNTQFGVITAADSVINSVWPIIGGIMLDWFGPNIITLLSTLIILTGSMLAALGTTLGTWRLLVAGNIVTGFGILVVESAQQKFFYHWFGADGLAFAFGLENAIAGTTRLVAGLTAIPIRDSTGSYTWCFWILVFFCAFSVAVSGPTSSLNASLCLPIFGSSHPVRPPLGCPTRSVSAGRHFSFYPGLSECSPQRKCYSLAQQVASPRVQPISYSNVDIPKLSQATFRLPRMSFPSFFRPSSVQVLTVTVIASI